MLKAVILAILVLVVLLILLLQPGYQSQNEQLASPTSCQSVLIQGLLRLIRFLISDDKAIAL